MLIGLLLVFSSALLVASSATHVFATKHTAALPSNTTVLSFSPLFDAYVRLFAVCVDAPSCLVGFDDLIAIALSISRCLQL
jgi:hypothetical protein